MHMQYANENHYLVKFATLRENKNKDLGKQSEKIQELET